MRDAQWLAQQREDSEGDLEIFVIEDTSSRSLNAIEPDSSEATPQRQVYPVLGLWSVGISTKFSKKRQELTRYKGREETRALNTAVRAAMAQMQHSGQVHVFGLPYTPLVRMLDNQADSPERAVFPRNPAEASSAALLAQVIERLETRHGMPGITRIIVMNEYTVGDHTGTQKAEAGVQTVAPEEVEGRTGIPEVQLPREVRPLALVTPVFDLWVAQVFAAGVRAQESRTVVETGLMYPEQEVDMEMSSPFSYVNWSPSVGPTPGVRQHEDVLAGAWSPFRCVPAPPPPGYLQSVGLGQPTGEPLTPKNTPREVSELSYVTAEGRKTSAVVTDTSYETVDARYLTHPVPPSETSPEAISHSESCAMDSRAHAEKKKTENETVSQIRLVLMRQQRRDVEDMDQDYERELNRLVRTPSPTALLEHIGDAESVFQEAVRTKVSQDKRARSETHVSDSEEERGYSPSSMSSYTSSPVPPGTGYLDLIQDFHLGIFQRDPEQGLLAAVPDIEYVALERPWPNSARGAIRRRNLALDTVFILRRMENRAIRGHYQHEEGSVTGAVFVSSNSPEVRARLQGELQGDEFHLVYNAEFGNPYLWPIERKYVARLAMQFRENFDVSKIYDTEHPAHLVAATYRALILDWQHWYGDLHEVREALFLGDVWQRGDYGVDQDALQELLPEYLDE